MSIVPSQPPDPFERQFDFTNFSQTQPNKQQPGDKIDLELDEARQSINQTISRLNEIQRDDGKLRDGVFDYTEINNLVLIAQGARDDAVTAAQEAQGFADDANGDAQVAVEAAGDAENYAFAANSSAVAALASQNASAASALAAAASATAAANTYQDFLDSLPLYDQDLNTTNDVQFNKIDITKTTDGSNKSTRYNEDGMLIGNLIGQAGQHYATYSGTGFEFPLVSYYGTSVKLEALSPLLTMEHSVLGGSWNSSLSETAVNFSLTADIDPFTSVVRSSNLTADAAVFTTTGIAGAKDSEVGAWGFGTELTEDNTQNTTVEFDGLHVNNAEGSTHVSWDGITFPDGSFQSTAATSGAFLPLAGGTMTGNIIFGTAGQYIGPGTFDTSRGGSYGLSLVCSVGYEFNWQAGWLTTTEQNSVTPRPLYLDSAAGTTLRAWDSTTSSGSELSHTGLVTTINTEGNLKTTTLSQYGAQWDLYNPDMGTETLRLDKSGLLYNNAFGNYKPFSFGNTGFHCENTDGYIDAPIGEYIGEASIKIGGTSNNLFLKLSNTGITFPDSTSQTTAFPPAGGDTTQYIDGTGALQTFPTGSTATKLQTTVYNNTGSAIPAFSLVYINGKHGTEPTVALSKADAELTSRSTLGFTTAAIADGASGTVTQVGLLEGVNTFAYAEGALLFLSPSVAGGFTDTQPYSPNHYVNVGTVIRSHPTLGTIQVRIMNSNELNELSDVQVSSSVTGDLLVKNGSGYWVSQSLATAGIQTTLSSATTSTEGKIQLATDAEAKSASNATKAITATGLTERAMSGGAWWLQGINFTSAVSGTGASTTVAAGFAKAVNAPTTATGYALIYSQGYGIAGLGKTYNTGIDWTKRVIMSARLYKSLSVTDANSVLRLTLGKANGTPAVGDLSAQGIGIKIAGSGAINIICHNGTGGMTTSATSFTPTTAQYYDLVLISDGAGNVTCYVNGSQVGTTTGGPTTQNATLSRNLIAFEAENLATITGPTSQYQMANWYLYIAP